MRERTVIEPENGLFELEVRDEDDERIIKLTVSHNGNELSFILSKEELTELYVALQPYVSGGDGD